LQRLVPCCIERLLRGRVDDERRPNDRAQQYLERRAFREHQGRAGAHHARDRAQLALVSFEVLARNWSYDQNRQMIEVFVARLQIDGRKAECLVHERGDLVARRERKLAIDYRREERLYERWAVQLRVELETRRWNQAN